jgi:hypothetical protein
VFNTNMFSYVSFQLLNHLFVYFGARRVAFAIVRSWRFLISIWECFFWRLRYSVRFFILIILYRNLWINYWLYLSFRYFLPLFVDLFNFAQINLKIMIWRIQCLFFNLLRSILQLLNINNEIKLYSYLCFYNLILNIIELQINNCINTGIYEL